jgi:peptidoglycan/LPS O-acetylase OafA/YrhL
VNARAERFPLVDSLRALAALSILALHAAILGGVMDDGAALAWLIARLDIGVPIFFVISGFLLYRPFVRARLEGVSAPAVLPYAWRRFLRIVPAYWVALTVIALVLSLDDVFSARGLAAYYGFLQLYSTETAGGGITQAWTLCVELSFYAALPLLAWGVRSLPVRGRLTPDVVLIGGLSVLSLVFNVFVAYGGLADAITYAPVPLLSALPASFFFFGFGMLMAAVSASGWEPGWLARRPGFAWAVALVAFVVVALVCARGGAFEEMSPAHWMARQVLYAVVAVAFVAPAVFGGEGGVVRRVLAWRPLLFLGLVSYGIYLWHLGVMLKLADWGWGDGGVLVHPYVHWALAGFVVTVAIASLSYFLVERPALSLKRLVGRPPGPPDEATVEPAPAAPPAVGGRRL